MISLEEDASSPPANAYLCPELSICCREIKAVFFLVLQREEEPSGYWLWLCGCSLHCPLASDPALPLASTSAWKGRCCVCPFSCRICLREVGFIPSWRPTVPPPHPGIRLPPFFFLSRSFPLPGHASPVCPGRSYPPTSWMVSGQLRAPLNTPWA